MYIYICDRCFSFANVIVYILNVTYNFLW